MPRIFLFSPAYMRMLQLLNVSLFINLCFVLFIFLAFFTHEKQFNLLLYMFVLSFAALSVTVRHVIMKLRMRQQMVLISEKGLFKKDRAALHRLDYRKVLRIKLWEDREGNVTAVHFITKNGKFKLQGYENMGKMLELMRPHIGDLVVIHRKRSFPHYDNVLLQLLLYLVAAFIISLYVLYVK